MKIPAAIVLIGLMGCTSLQPPATNEQPHAPAPEQAGDATPQGSWANFEAAYAAAEAKQPDEAIRLLGRAVDAGFDETKYLRIGPPFAPIQSDPRFIALVERARANGERTYRERGVGSGLGRSTPEAEGIDATALRTLMDAARASYSDAVVILRNGKVVAEEYFGDQSKRIETMSGTKSMVNLAVGLALDEGKLASVDMPVHQLFPEWRQGKKESITVRHLLNHTSGLQSGSSEEIYRSPDFVRLALAADLEDDPGTWFHYNNKAANLVPAIVQRATGQRMDEYLKVRLFGPLGIEHTDWSLDKAGNPHGMSGFKVHPLDWAKVGQVLLDGGVWQGKRVLSREWIEESTRTAQPYHPGCGLLWWLVLHDRKTTIPAAALAKVQELGFSAGDAAKLADLMDTPTPSTELRKEITKRVGAEHAEQFHSLLNRARILPRVTGESTGGFYADGYLGQYLLVLPAQQIVAVRMSTGAPDVSDEQVNFVEFFDLVRALVPREAATARPTSSAIASGANGGERQPEYPLSHAKDAPNLPSKIALCAEDEPGEKLVISGTVYEEDCTTPVPGAVVYLYQTDVRGVYSDEKENDKRPKLRGYLKTDAHGGYEIRTIRPGHYPHMKSAAHIHFHVETLGLPEYMDAFLFSHDPLLADWQAAMMEKQPKDFGLIELMPGEAGVLRGVHHIHAPPNTAKYAAALLAAKTPLERQLLELERDYRSLIPTEKYDALVAAMKTEAAAAPNDALERELRGVLDNLNLFFEFRTTRFIFTDDAGDVLTERKIPGGSGPQHPFETRTTEVADVRLHEHGDTAIMNWLDVERVQIKEQKFSKSGRCTAAFVKRNDKWQLIAGHVSPVGFERTEASVDPAVLDSYSGKYQDPLWGPFRVSREDNALVFTSANGYRTEYLPESETEFFLRDEQARKAMLQTVSFVRNNEGRVTHCVFRQNDGQNVVVKRIR